MSAVDTIVLQPTGRAAKGGRNVALLIVGYSLLLILVYLVVARKPIVDAIVGGSWIGSYAAKAWVAPVDPLAALGAGKPISSGASSSTSTGSTGQISAPGAASSLPNLPPSPTSFAGPNQEPPVSSSFPRLTRQGPWKIRSRRILGRGYTFGELATAEAWARSHGRVLGTTP